MAPCVKRRDSSKSRHDDDQLEMEQEYFVAHYTCRLLHSIVTVDGVLVVVVLLLLSYVPVANVLMLPLFDVSATATVLVVPVHLLEYETLQFLCLLPSPST